MKLPNFGWITLRWMPIRPSPASTAIGLCATTQIRSLGKRSISIGNPTAPLNARTPIDSNSATIRRATSLVSWLVRWNSRLLAERAGLRTASRFIVHTKLISARGRRNAASRCGRSSASSGRSISTKPTSSAPARWHSSRSQPASSTSGGAGTSPAATRRRTSITFGCESILAMAAVLRSARGGCFLTVEQVSMVKQLTVEHGRHDEGAMVLGRTYDAQVCSLARALEIVGERWTLLIVRDALLGLTRFEQFSESLGLAVPVLALMQWGDAHLAGPAGPPRLARHAGCAGDV